MHLLDLKCLNSNWNSTDVPKIPINCIPALVPIMAWRWPGNKPLSEPMAVRLPSHICISWPQWVNLKSRQLICLLHSFQLTNRFEIYVQKFHRATQEQGMENREYMRIDFKIIRRGISCLYCDSSITSDTEGIYSPSSPSTARTITTTEARTTLNRITIMGKSMEYQLVISLLSPVKM